MTRRACRRWSSDGLFSRNFPSKAAKLGRAVGDKPYFWQQSRSYHRPERARPLRRRHAVIRQQRLIKNAPNLEGSPKCQELRKLSIQPSRNDRLTADYDKHR